MSQVERILQITEIKSQRSWKKSLREAVRSLTCLVGGKTTTLPIKRKRSGRPTSVAKRPHKCQHHDRDIFD